MPRPNSNIPNFLPPRHLYRHILRETSYLPPAIRPNITTQIRSKFRNHRKNDLLREKHRARGANVLRKLRAANSGHRKLMEEFMMQAFGRKGARRRSLLSDYVRPEPPSDTEALEAMINDAQAGKTPVNEEVAKLVETTIKEVSSEEQRTQETRDNPSDEKEIGLKKPLVRRKPKPLQPAFYHKWDVPKLTKLLSSQRAVQQSADVAWPKNNIKSLNQDTDIPKTNIWGRPTPERVCQAKRAHFWKRLVPKAMPPLDSSEWEFLGQLAKGAQEEEQWKIPERRPSAKPVRVVKSDTKPPTLDWDWEGYATQPTSRVERINPLSQYAHVGPDKTEHPYHNSHFPRTDLTPRWFRRAYQRIWHITSKTEVRPHTRKTTYVWGSFNPGVAAPTRRHLEVFEGVDSKGQKPKAAKGRASNL